MHKDLVGEKYNRLTVLKYVYTRKKKAYWLCQCECGNTTIVSTSDIKGNKIKSCGCLRIEKITKHNLSATRLYHIWHNLKARCLNLESKESKYYGQRGIKVCDEWLNFKVFYIWAINNGYKENLTIERIDVNGDYCPQNCRWATPKEQGRNKRNNKLITFNGETHCVTEWAEILGIKAVTIKKRLRDGFSPERVLSKCDFRKAVTQ